MPSSPSALSLSHHQGLFQWVSCSHQITKIMEFQLSIIPSQWGLLIPRKIDWFDFLAVQVTRRSLLQHHTLKALIIWCSTFFTLQHSQPYVPTGKTIALTIWIFVSRVMSLIFNTLSRFAIAFLPRSKYLLISWLQSPSIVILEPKNRKPVTISTFPSSTCQAGMGWDAVILFFSPIFSFKLAFPTLLLHPHQEAL